MEENWIKVYKAHDYVETNEPIWLEQVLSLHHYTILRVRIMISW